MTDSDKQIPQREMPIMENGLYYHTYSENGGDMYVKVINENSLVLMVSPLTITYRRGVYNTAGSTEITEDKFLSEYSKINYSLLVTRNTNINTTI